MTNSTTTELRDRGVYKLRGEMYVARRNDDRPEGNYLYALYEVIGGGPVIGVPSLFVDLDGETIFSVFGGDSRDGAKVSELTDTGLNSMM